MIWIDEYNDNKNIIVFWTRLQSASQIQIRVQIFYESFRIKLKVGVIYYEIL